MKRLVTAAVALVAAVAIGGVVLRDDAQPPGTPAAVPVSALASLTGPPEDPQVLLPTGSPSRRTALLAALFLSRDTAESSRAAMHDTREFLLSSGAGGPEIAWLQERLRSRLDHETSEKLPTPEPPPTAAGVWQWRLPDSSSAPATSADPRACERLQEAVQAGVDQLYDALVAPGARACASGSSGETLESAVSAATGGVRAAVDSSGSFDFGSVVYLSLLAEIAHASDFDLFDDDWGTRLVTDRLDQLDAELSARTIGWAPDELNAFDLLLEPEESLDLPPAVRTRLQLIVRTEGRLPTSVAYVGLARAFAAGITGLTGGDVDVSTLAVALPRNGRWAEQTMMEALAFGLAGGLDEGAREFLEGTLEDHSFHRRTVASALLAREDECVAVRRQPDALQPEAPEPGSPVTGYQVLDLALAAQTLTACEMDPAQADAAVLDWTRAELSATEGSIVETWQAVESHCVVAGADEELFGDALDVATSRAAQLADVGSFPAELDIETAYATVRLADIASHGCGDAWWAHLS